MQNKREILKKCLRKMQLSSYRKIERERERARGIIKKELKRE